MIADHGENHGFAAGAEQGGDFARAADGGAVDFGDDVAGAHSGAFGRGAGIDGADEDAVFDAEVLSELGREGFAVDADHGGLERDDVEALSGKARAAENGRRAGGVLAGGERGGEGAFCAGAPDGHDGFGAG